MRIQFGFGGIKLGIKLLALDLDGTLLDDSQNISQQNIDAVKRAGEKGVNIVIATGRTNLGAEDIFRKLELKEFLIAYNGALIKNMKENKVIKHLPLPMHQTYEILEYVSKENLYVNLYLNNNVYANRAGKELDYYKKIMNIEPSVLEEDVVEFLDRATTKLLIIEKDLFKVDQILFRLQDQFAEDLNITKSIEDCIDIMNKNVSKGDSLEDLTRMLGFKAEEVAAVGDGNNDLEMIKFAGTSAAVANAEEIVKENADYITASNNENGVAQFIEEFIL